jgi:hypothetical protein
LSDSRTGGALSVDQHCLYGENGIDQQSANTTAKVLGRTLK